MRLLHYIPLDIDELLPKPEYFSVSSQLHGRLHVARVIILGAKLLELVNDPDFATPLWAAAFIHDLGRKHDGYCQEHGTWSAEKVATSPEIMAVLIRGGMKDEQWSMVQTASIHHSKSVELSSDDAHFKLTSLLKDADGLDRVRLGDLNPAFLRHPQAHSLIRFSERLFAATNENCESNDPKLMSRILAHVNQLA